MAAPRRLIAALVAVSLSWSGLTLGVATPSAQATTATITTTPTSVGSRAPHDPATYYAGTEGLSGATLAAKLHTIVKADAVALSYGQVYEYLPLTDPDTARPGYLIDFYSGTSILASNRCGSSCAGGAWNREHTWPQSHGNFGTSAGIGTDLHHMRPEFGTTNSSRSNKDFDNGGSAGVPDCADCRSTTNTFEPRSAVKGDLARGLLYMAVRYEADDRMNLKMNDLTCNESGPPNMGKLSTLVAWSLADPPDDRERTRNDLVDGSYQHNRNPFIDHPEWVTSIFGNGVGLGPACGQTSGSDYVPGGTGPANTAPTTSPMAATTAEDTAKAVTLVASDADGDSLTWTRQGQAPAHGTATVTGSTLTYTPAADFNGTDTIGVRVSDGRGGTADTTVTITVSPVNDAPTAAAVSATTATGSSTQLTLLGADVDGDTLSYATSTPAHGTVTVNGAIATYTPNAGYAGSDSFTYTVTDPSGATSPTATASITITAAASHDPVAMPTSATTPEDQPVTVTLSATDPDGDPLSYRVASAPAHGTARMVGDTQATYTPARDFNGTDSFTFTASDPATISAPARVSITVTPVNDAPVATPVSATTRESTAVALTLSGTDVDGDELTYGTATTSTNGGTVTLNGTQATYTPAPGFSGQDSFGWTVSDGTVSTTGTAAVTVTANRRPTVGAISTSTPEDGSGVTIPLTGADADGDALTYATASGPAHGTVEVAGATATYVPTPGFSGTDTFTYTASDRLVASLPATVTVTVTPVNHPPTVSPLELGTTAGTPVTLTLTDLAAADPDGDDLSITAVGSTNATITAGGTTVTYTPAVRSGSESFVVTVSDGRGESTDALVTVTISARTATLSLSTPTPTRGSAVVTTIRVTGPGTRPTGTVTLRTTGRTLGTATLSSTGTATIRWVPSAAGATSLVTSYGGDSLFAPVTSPVTRVSVARSAARLGFTSGTLRRGRAGVLKVSVAPVGSVAATGKVQLTVAGKKVTATLSRGVATFTVAKLPQASRLPVSARYVGDTQYAAATASHTYVIPS